MSPRPTPSKSPICCTVRLGSMANGPVVRNEMIPPMYQMERGPSVPRHNRSSLPLPSKSPMPWVLWGGEVGGLSAGGWHRGVPAPEEARKDNGNLAEGPRAADPLPHDLPSC